MGIAGSRVGIIGGSIAGCAAAVALRRAGCDVTVFERSDTELRDRGSGIAIPTALRDTLVEAGYLPAEYASCPLDGRYWIRDDGTPLGHTMYFQAGAPAVSNNWGVLWRNLRRNVPDEAYVNGVTAGTVNPGEGEVHVTLSDGRRERFDVLVGADGYRSQVRQLMHPASTQEYAGYILWRGNYPESRLDDRTALDHIDLGRAWVTIVFDGGHGVLYPIPGFDDRADTGHRRVNWAVYAPTPDGLDATSPHSIPPGEVKPEWYESFDWILNEYFPRAFEALFRASPLEEVSIQPIYDESISSYVDGRMLLIGDAGTITRPHTGSGATKALQDALLLEQLATQGEDWTEVLAAYNSERVATGNNLVEMGRRIGRAQVTETPDWSTMDAERIESWTRATLAGDKLYLYGDADDLAASRG